MKYPNIEAERARNFFSQEKLAEKLNISSRTYYNWLKGKVDIPTSKLLEMAKIFNVSMEYLLGEKEIQQIKLSDFPTCELVEELKLREGVETHVAEPHKDFELSLNGPANVLVVID